MTAQQQVTPSGPLRVLLCADSEGRVAALSAQIGMALPRATVAVTDTSTLGERTEPEIDAVVLDAAAGARNVVDAARSIRARGFLGPLVVVMAAPDEASVLRACQSLGAISISQSVVDAKPMELAAALATAASRNAAITEEVAYARRVFAAGQVALSLQHSINNPLAALLAEAQLLQLEELSPEQRGSVDRMVELCRRIVALVRRLDGLATSG